ncbi:MAG: UDP-N-acetylmuramate dehydrogenase [Gemmatimonadetes bacterium]|nr:UDP-N-acetylmuramate dehydrogenase [Gemmatimonadota bacterium]
MLIRESVPLAPHTTIGLGGPARYFCEIRTEEDVREALALARERNLPLQILGGGSNVVFADAGFPGLVAKMSIGEMAFEPGRGNAVEMTAGAGVDWDEVVAAAVECGLSGIECLSGIPGTVGGTPIQNVGAYGQEIADTLIEVDCLDRAGMMRVTFDREACRFGYRTSRFKKADRDRYVVFAVRLRLRRDVRPVLRYPELAAAVGRRGGIEQGDPPAAVRLVRETVRELRKAKSMLLDPSDPNTRSVGSFFMNPVIPERAFRELVNGWHASGGRGDPPGYPDGGNVKVPAAWLVENAGFGKGYRRGGVGTSSHHALALVNYGGTTGELLALAQDIERLVLERFGIRLEREAVVIPG